MIKLSIALIAGCLLTSHLMAQPADIRGSYPMLSGRNLGVRQNLDGGVCFPAPSYQNCIYDHNYYTLELYSLWAFYTFWNGMDGSDRPQPSYTKQSPEPPPPPPPPVTLVVHEYSWPEEVNTSTTFSIVTTSGTVYLATMVWVQEGNFYLTLVDGDVRQLPLSSVSNSLTQTANAQKNLNLHLPGTQDLRPSVTPGN
jgi:hypothetical protein